MCSEMPDNRLDRSFLSSSAQPSSTSFTWCVNSSHASGPTLPTRIRNVITSTSWSQDSHLFAAGVCVGRRGDATSAIALVKWNAVSETHFAIPCSSTSVFHWHGQLSWLVSHKWGRAVDPCRIWHTRFNLSTLRSVSKYLLSGGGGCGEFGCKATEVLNLRKTLIVQMRSTTSLDLSRADFA